MPGAAKIYAAEPHLDTSALDNLYLYFSYLKGDFLLLLFNNILDSNLKNNFIFEMI